MTTPDTKRCEGIVRQVSRAVRPNAKVYRTVSMKGKVRVEGRHTVKDSIKSQDSSFPCNKSCKCWCPGRISASFSDSAGLRSTLLRDSVSFFTSVCLFLVALLRICTDKPWTNCFAISREGTHLWYPHKSTHSPEEHSLSGAALNVNLGSRSRKRSVMHVYLASIGRSPSRNHPTANRRIPAYIGCMRAVRRRIIHLSNGLWKRWTAPILLISSLWLS